MTTYLTTRDLQDLIRVDKSTIYRMAEDGRLPAVKVGRQWRFPADEVRSALGLVAGSSVGEPAPAVIATPALQALVEFAGQALGTMVMVTDMAGRPLTSVANPCGMFNAIGDAPDVVDRCVAGWRDYGAHPELVPRWKPSLFGFLCARAFVRSGDRLVGMLIVGGIAPTEWPPSEAEAAAIAGRLGVPEDVIANSSPAVHDLDLDRRQQVLELLPPLAVAVSRMVEQRTRLVSTLEGIAELAGAATERRSLS